MPHRARRRTGRIQLRGEWRLSHGGEAGLRPDSPATYRRRRWPAPIWALWRSSRVNLERAAALGDRLSGHIVQGHVDGTAAFVSLEPLARWKLVAEKCESHGADRYRSKGSVTLDGVSLTIASIEDCVVGVAIIPHTYTQHDYPNLQRRDEDQPGSGSDREIRRETAGSLSRASLSELSLPAPF